MSVKSKGTAARRSTAGMIAGSVPRSLSPALIEAGYGVISQTTPYDPVPLSEVVP
jgi:hypothetical protein